jgi:hypothetical protein
MEGELEVAWKRIGDSGDGPFSLSRSGWKKEGILKWEGRTARWGWCWSLAEAALIRSHVRRTCLLCKGGVLGARSEADGKDSPLRAEPMLGLDCKWRTKRRKRPSDGIHESEIRLGMIND